MLVLIERDRTYKCAKCGGKFPKLQIENKAFREWNKKEREKDKEALTKGKKYKKLILKPNTDKKESQKNLTGYI
jgi:hypothetical protein